MAKDISANQQWHARGLRGSVGGDLSSKSILVVTYIYTVS